jgi:DoxX-like family
MEMSVVVGFALNLSIIAILPIALSGVMYLFKIPVAVKNMELVGFSHMLAPFGVIKIVIAVMTLIQATSFVGVIIATGWMGGAIAAHIRIRENYVI